MAFRIACDVDGTIAAMEAALQKEAEQLFGPDVAVQEEEPSDDGAPTDPAAPTTAPNSRRRLSSSEVRRLWDHVASIENFWSGLEEVEPGAVARFAELRTSLGLEVIFLTQRPRSAGEVTQLQTQRWLERHGFELPSVFVLRGSRGKAAAALHVDVVIDDRPDNCLDVMAESRAKPILVWRGSGTAVPQGVSRLGIETVLSMDDAMSRIAAMVTPPAPAGWTTRLRRALGR